MTDVQYREDIEDLQSRLAFQEDALQTMNDQLVQQAESIANLSAQLQILNKKYQDAMELLEDRRTAEAEPRPPHY